MSYAIEWSNDARREFSSLPFDVQEALLDELDILARAGGDLPGRPLPLTVDTDIRHQTSEGVYYVFIKVEYDPPRRVLAVVRLAHFFRATGP